MPLYISKPLLSRVILTPAQLFLPFFQVIIQYKYYRYKGAIKKKKKKKMSQPPRIWEAEARGMQV
jgi:hypothetical protein